MSYFPTGATSRRTQPTSATHVWCDKLSPPHWRRKRADGKDPCTAATSTARHTPSAQQLCKEAGIPTTQVMQQKHCQQLVLSARDRAAGKKGMAPALAAAAARKKYPEGKGIVREGRKSVLYPLCRQAGVPEAMLQQCYDEIRKGRTPEEQAKILETIAKEVAEQTGAGVPGVTAAAPGKFPMWILLAGGGALALVLLLKRRRK
jgi:hypothetical protein